LPGALLAETADRTILGTETIGDDSYTTQRHELSLVAMRAGKLDLPPIGVRFASKREPTSAAEEQVVRTARLSIDARMPPGAERLSTIICSKSFAATQTWKPQPGAKLQVGASFERRVTMTADDVPALVFPPLPDTKMDHLADYAKAPSVADRYERGSLLARREDAIVYVCQTPGTVKMPDLAIPWFDLAEKKVKRVVLPGLTFEIAKAPEKEVAGQEREANDSNAKHFGWNTVWIACGLAALLGVAMWSARKGLIHRAVAKMRSHRENESEHVHRLLAACRQDNAPVAYRELCHWLSAEAPYANASTLKSAIMGIYDDETLAQLIAQLEESVISPRAEWRGESLAAALKHARGRSKRRSRGNCLPRLNP
jgi:hypothetical protein